MEKGDKVIIAISGGADSIFMYTLFKMIKHEYALEFIFCHVNHMLRGKNALRDQHFIEKLGEKEGVTTFVLQEDINEYAQKNKIGVEEAGREVRYSFFKKIMEAEHASKIALAHNFDDNIETFMFRLMRGSSILGLSSIPVKRDSFIRPIMGFYKSEIVRFLNENEIEYVNDETNDETIYTRNKIRLELIPFIEKEFNSKFKQKISYMIDEISTLKNEIENSIGEVDLSQKELEVEQLKKLGEYSLTCLLNEYLKQRGIECNRDIISNSVKIIKKEGNFRYSIGKGKELVKKYGKIYVSESKKGKNSKVENQIPLIIGSEQIFNQYRFFSEICDNAEKNSNNVIYLKYCDLIADLQIRNRKEGDYIYLSGVEGKKKLKKLFIDLKIDSEIRGSMPLLAIGSEIIWIPEIRVSKNYSAAEGEKVLKIIFFKEDDNFGR